MSDIVLTDANADAGSVTPATIEQMKPGASHKAVATHTVTQADIDAGYVYNLAKVTGKSPSGALISDDSHDPDPIDPEAPIIDDCAECTATPVIGRPRVALVVEVINSGSGRNGAFLLGDEIEYRFTIVNRGNTTLHDLVLNDAKLGLKAVFVDANLKPGERIARIFSYVVTAEDILAKEVVNTATVRGTSLSGLTATDVSGDEVTTDKPTVVPVAEGPVARADEVTTPQHTPVVIQVLDNDQKGSTAIDPRTVRLMDPETGKLSKEVAISGEGVYTVETDGTVTFTPVREFHGVSKIDYVVGDVNGLEADRVSITVSVVQSEPVAVDDSKEGSFNTEIAIALLDNDQPDGASLDPASVEIVTQPQHGTLQKDADGVVRYIPNPYYTGTDAFTYRVRDVNGNWTEAATVRITISGFQIPNIITPNGDGQNDRFVIIGLAEYDHADVVIFNRWGNEVYRSRDYKQNWEGQGVSEGTYYYLITLRKEGKETIHKGWVVIKRK